jgi:hypothetical protein
MSSDVQRMHDAGVNHLPRTSVQEGPPGGWFQVGSNPRHSMATNRHVCSTAYADLSGRWVVVGARGWLLVGTLNQRVRGSSARRPTKVGHFQCTGSGRCAVGPKGGQSTSSTSTGLVAKIPRSRRWCVTAFGHWVMTAAVRLRQPRSTPRWREGPENFIAKNKEPTTEEPNLGSARRLLNDGQVVGHPPGVHDLTISHARAPGVRCSCGMKMAAFLEHPVACFEWRKAS